MKQLNILRSAVAAGQVEQVIPLGRVSFSKKRRKKKFEHRIEKHIKRIKSDDRLQWADGCTTVPYGITVTGLAFWDDTQATFINGYTISQGRFFKKSKKNSVILFSHSIVQ